MALMEQNFIAREANEIVIGLLGIVLTLFVQKIVEAWRNQVLRKKFPIAGIYLTKYMDQGRSHTEVVELKQQGRHISGQSVENPELNGPSRTWLFEGEIRSEGYLTGTYKPAAFTDKGFGAFFLRFEKNGDMKGYWIGRDADESHIVSGEYTFCHQPQFSITQLNKSDNAQVLRIAEQRLGDAYINPKDLTSDDRAIALCARVQGRVVAFATGRMVKSDEFLQKIRDRLGDAQISLLSMERRVTDETDIGFVASAATDPQFEGRGLGASLVGQCINGLEARGANVLIATAWKSSKGIQAGSILECRGFQRIMEIPNYWENDSLTYGYSCPTCGSPPCHCTAVIYCRSRHSPSTKSR